MSGIRRALAVSTTERYLNLAITFATTLVVSRLLTPAEIGVWAIGLATATAHPGRARVHERRLPHSAQRSDARGGAGRVHRHAPDDAAPSQPCSLLGAPLIAAFYGEPKLVHYLRVAALAVLLEVVAAPLMALMRRDMAFTRACRRQHRANVDDIRRRHRHPGRARLQLHELRLGMGRVCGALRRARRLPAARPVGVQARAAALARHARVRRLQRGERVPVPALRGDYRPWCSAASLSFDAAGLYNRALLVCQLPDKVVLGGAAPVILPALAAEVRAGRQSRRHRIVRAVSFITAAAVAGPRRARHPGAPGGAHSARRPVAERRAARADPGARLAVLLHGRAQLSRAGVARGDAGPSAARADRVAAVGAGHRRRLQVRPDGRGAELLRHRAVPGLRVASTSSGATCPSCGASLLQRVRQKRRHRPVQRRRAALRRGVAGISLRHVGAGRAAGGRPGRDAGGSPASGSPSIRCCTRSVWWAGS